MSSPPVSSVGWRLLQVWTSTGSHFVPRIRRSPVIVGLVPSLVGRKGLRELVAIVALFGNYGLTPERRSIVQFSSTPLSPRKEEIRRWFDATASIAPPVPL